MATLQFADAERLSRNGRPWTFRLELHDPSINAHRFWLATGRSRNEPVEIHYGRVGNAPQILVKDWSYVTAKAPEKEGKGYDYVDTPFVRVRKATIDAHLAKLKASGQPVPQPTLPPKAAPVAPKPTPAPVAAPTPPPAAPATGGNPYNRVATVKPAGGGQWVAMDASGRQLFAMPQAGAMKLVQDGTATVAGL